MKPLRMQPVCKDYLWGGTRLAKLYHKHSDAPIIAESWELSTHPDGMCTVSGGEYAGQTLAQVIKTAGCHIISNQTDSDRLPVLIKLIDAEKDLSIQVHPDDAFAKAHENDFGKTEMWYVLDCLPSASLYYGFKKDVTPDEFRTHIAQGTLTEILNKVSVKKGDMFFIPPGTIHAIGAGTLLAEVQQCSNVTYRVFDYNRLGADGQPRALHIEKTLQVASLSAQPRSATTSAPAENTEGGAVTLLAQCQYFTAKSLSVTGKMRLQADAHSFHSLLCLEGQCVLKGADTEMQIKKGDSIFIPAAFGEYILEGNAEVLLSTL